MPRAHRGDASERGTRVTTAGWVQLVTDALDKIVIPLAGLAIAWSITHWGLRQKAEATLARQDLLGRVAREAVAAAEQALAGQAGADKRAAALNFAVSFLAARGITPTPAEEQALGAAIEAAVRDLKVGDALHAALTAPAAVTATPGPGQEASVTVQPAPGRPAVMTPFVPTPDRRPDATIATTGAPGFGAPVTTTSATVDTAPGAPAPPPAVNDPTATKPVGAGTGVQP